MSTTTTPATAPAAVAADSSASALGATASSVTHQAVLSAPASSLGAGAFADSAANESAAPSSAPLSSTASRNDANAQGAGAESSPDGSTASPVSADAASSSSPVSAATPVAGFDAESAAASAERTQQQRRQQLDRILACHAFNPYDVLDLSPASTLADVRKQHRLLSLSVHPDRFAGNMVPRAQQAFSLITKAKNDLLDDDIRAKLAGFITTARALVIAQNNRAECARRNIVIPPLPATTTAATMTEAVLAAASVVESVISERVANGTTPAFPVWAQHQPGAFDAAVRAALRELLWDDEQRRAHSEREAGRAEAEAAAERTARIAAAESEKQRAQQWEDGRDDRVASWRKFASTGGGPGKRFFKPPTSKGERTVRAGANAGAKGTEDDGKRADWDEWA